jgi:hypothetical protein
MRVSSRVNIFLCLFVVSSAKERREGKKSEAFDLGYTTLILNASQQKKNKISSVKRGRVSLFSAVPHYLFTSPIKRSPRFKTFIL